MPLFQKSVVNKYLSTLDTTSVRNAFNNFLKSYSDTERLDNIRSAKEEQYQEGFLRDVFVQSLGYTSNPDRDYNLTTEFKNLTDSKKADGAILKNKFAVAVIELKSTKTKNLEDITAQAFNYKNYQPACKYVITSNYEKIRFYIDDATNHEEFELFDLNYDNFKFLYLCLSCGSILNDIPLKMKEESKIQEENVTKKLYKDYSAFKHKLFENLVKNNPEIDKLTLLKKSQKLLDRLLFMFFAEDKGLIPPNMITQIIDDFKKLKELDAYQPLYEQFRKFFGYIDCGYESKRFIIPPYNGELFKPDEILSIVKIDDEVLIDDTLKLSAYDFDTDVDVNILGHIFEHSLNEIEAMQAEALGEEFSAKTSKRKKDGIYYTPKYITKYIVDNTLGKLCEEKKSELGLNEFELDESLKYRKSKKLTDELQELLEKLMQYRDYLLSLKICDPACGSGAFLIQALDRLINEHEFIDKNRRIIEKDALGLFDIENSILENNLYGVDINEEAVEIAKLSLWLRTARKDRKLSGLNGKIKCGNSLIDAPEIAGDKAFKWEEEFPEVFAKGGFDVVIGNPPYVISQNLSEEEKNFYYRIYKSSLYQINLYLLFIEMSIGLLNKNGYLSLIVPNTWLVNLTLKDFRKYLLENNDLMKIVDLTKINVFDDVVVLPIIFLLSKSIKYKNIEILEYIKNNFISKGNLNYIDINELNNYLINYQTSNKIKEIIRKIDNIISIQIEEFAKVSFGVKFYQVNKGKPKQNREIVDNQVFTHSKKENITCKMMIEGKDIDRYYFNWGGLWIEYGIWLAEPRSKDLFIGERILVRRIVNERFTATYINEDYCNNSLLHTIKIIKNKVINPKYLLSIINSRLFGFYFIKKYSREEKTFPEIRVTELKALPIPNILPEAQLPFIAHADIMLEKNKELQEFRNNFLTFIKVKFNIEKPTQKLQNWHTLSFKDFITELKKAKAALSSAEEYDLMQLFDRQKAEAQAIKAIIDQTDREIDLMVYELYELTEEEIRIVEGKEIVNSEK